MASILTLERRLALLETRLAEIEGSYGETLYELKRFSVRTTINLGRVMDHLGVPAATEEEVDDAIDAE